MEKINIKELIQTNIHRYSLKEIKNIIEKEYQTKEYQTEIQLNIIDHAYIEKKYIKYCLDCWIEEIGDSLNEHVQIENDTEKFIVLYCTVNNIKHFKEILSPFNNSKYYELLMKHYDVITQHNEEALLRRFKGKCLELLFARSNTIITEINFLEVLIEFLNMFEKDEQYSDMSALRYLSHADISSDEFFQTIMNLDGINDVKLERLKYTIQFLKGTKHVTLMEKYKEIIRAYFKPITIKKSTIDNRVIIELIGGNFYLSEIADSINSYLSSDSDIEEVRFICSGIIYADADFKNGDWHGKNIVIYAKAIRICETITWDVSGKSAESVTSCKAGTADDGNGIDGECGKCGESGGNIFIYADSIFQSQRLSILSNGGDGSDGQNGGDGKDGKNGTGIYYSDFVNMFPSSAKFSGYVRINNVRRIVRNICSLGTINISWDNKLFPSIDDLIKSLENQSLTFDSHNIYIEAQTKEGHKIYFSYSHSFLAQQQSFVLYKGSLGQPGGRGGMAGLSGQGGYSGEVISDSDIIVNANAGRNGENGVMGKDGNHGQNGWDMAYTDYVLWNYTQFYGKDQNRVLKLNYYYNSGSERIYVPYRKYINSDHTYAEISSHPIPKPASTTFVKQEEISQAERQIRAVRKKNISQNHIFAHYSQYLVKIDVGLYQNLQVQMKSIEKNILEKMENNVQQMKEISQVNITRVKSSCQNTKARDVMNFQIDPIEIQEMYRDLIETLLQSVQSISLHDWIKLRNIQIKLKNIQIKYSDLNKIFNLFEAQKNIHSAEKDIVQNIEQLLIEKYRLAILQEISVIDHYEYVNNIPHTQVTAEKTIKYLFKIENNPQVNLGFNGKLGNLQQYFFEDNEKQRKSISEFCTTENMTKNIDVFKNSVIAFVMDEGEMDGAHPTIKMHCEAYNNFVGKQNVKLKEFLKQSELETGSHDEMIAQWFNSLNISTMQAKLKNDLTKDKQFNLLQFNPFIKSSYKSLYEQFIKLFDERFNWNDCYKDMFNPNIFNTYVQHIQHWGPLSSSYRDLLAHIFDIGIYVYTNRNNEIYLFDVHNSQSTEILYVLYTDKKFIQLDFNKDYFQLDMRREKISDFYIKIIEEVESLKQKKDCDEYLKKKLFLSEKKKVNTSDSSSKIAIDEEEDICDIVQFFSSLQEREKHTLRLLLEKISSKFIGQYGIVHAIAKCFSCNRRHLTYHELYCLINTILDFVIEDMSGLNIFRWIITVYPQHQWINEIILLKLENYFRKPLTMIHEWRRYLTKVQDKKIMLLLSSKLDQSKKNKTISIECIENILYLLSNISEPVPGLQELELSEWPYAIKEKYWITKLRRLTKWEDEELQKASYYLLSLDNNTGISVVDRFIDTLLQKNILSPSKNTESVSLKKNDFLQILSHFHNGKWIFSEKVFTKLISCQMDTWMTEMRKIFPIDGKDRDISMLIELMKGNGNTSKHILDDLCEIESIIKFHSMNETETMDENVIMERIKELRSNISACEGKDAKIQYVKKNTTEIFNLINNAIQLKRNFRLRDTQKLAVLALLRNQKNTLMQVSTGEGKSLIVVALSIFKTLCGQKVDIITSSSVLAKRDAEINSDIYELFSISVSHNCMSDAERFEVYSCKDVIYGDLAGFQRDYLMDRFYDMNILGDRAFENVVIDEVDSMLLDKGNNMLYLSHRLPNLDKLESIYVYIWQLINRPITNREEFARIFDTKAIKHAVLCDLYGSITKESIGKLDLRMSDQQINTIWERLGTNNIINSDGYLLRDDVSEEDIKDVLLPNFERYERYLVYLFKSIARREKRIHVPNYLKSFVALHLDTWINSAKTALFMQERTNYIVDVDKKRNRPDRKAFITIIDQDTGTDQSNSEWDEALHQFLQLKHGCKLSMQNLKAVFISNVSYLKRYSNLYGLTGTLGSQRERDLLREIYQVDFVTIPTMKMKKFDENNPIVCSDSEEWGRTVYEKSNAFIAAGRSVLIICETVKDVESLYHVFNTRKKKEDTRKTNVHTYTRDYESFIIGTDDNRLCVGQIIIATNLAGRGTDIKITDKLDQAGGLHVCLTYLPANNRVEQQAFGRASRCGKKGSGGLIIQGSRNIYSISQISQLKKERDFEEIRRISDIKLFYETRISMEEDAFRKFQKEYERLKNILKKNKVIKEITDILLCSCLDEWAFWLDANNKYIKDEQDKQKYEESLVTLIEHFKTLNAKKCEDWEYWIREPSQIIKLAKYFAQNKKQDMAIKLFDHIIENEPYFSETAHYYKAFALIKRNINKNDKVALIDLKSELRQASRLLEKHRDHALMMESIIDTLKQRNSGIMQIDAFKEQHKNVSIMYQILLQSIDDILGHYVTPHSLEKYDINEELAETLYDDLLENGILKKSKVSKNIPKETVKKISEQYGVIWEKLNTFLTKYQNCDIDIKQFEKDMKNSVTIPNKEEFWKLLVKKNILKYEVKYVKIIMQKLQNIDPSLADSIVDIKEQVIEKHVLKCDKEELLFNAYIVKEENSNDIMFEKNALKKLIGNEKYKLLKQRSVFICNKKATFDSSKVDSVTFPRFDSITQEDFTKRDIVEEEANQILAELIEREILAKQENDCYRLITDHNKIADLQLSSYYIYEAFVELLLNICFAYRIALQKLTRDFKEEVRTINLQIITKPYQSMIWSLMEEGIIKPVKVSNNVKNLEEKLNSMYNCDIKKLQLIKVLDEEDKRILVNEKTINSRILSLKYSVNEGLTKTIKKIIDDYTYMSKKDTKNAIATNLERLKNTFKTLDVSDCNLTSFLEYVNTNGPFKGSDYPEEDLQVFILNGLDHLLTLQEKRWTWKMIFKTFGIIVLGIMQIAVGHAITLYTGGVLSNLSAAFISEGMNDIFFAMMSFKSGYFSWNSYKQHKVISLATTGLTFGIATWMSSGNKVSSYASKIVGPNISANGIKITEMTGTQMIKHIGRKIVTKEFVKRVALSSLEGIAYGIINATVEMTVNNYLQNLCRNIGSAILTKIDQVVNQYDMHDTLEKAYRMLGSENAIVMITELSNNFFTKRDNNSQLVSLCKTAIYSVINGVRKAKLEAKGSTEIITLLKLMGPSTEVIHKTIILYKISTLTENMLSTLKQDIQTKTELNQLIQQQQDVTHSVDDNVDANMDIYKQKIKDTWKSLLHQQAGLVIEEEIVKPIMSNVMQQIMSYAGKQIQKKFKDIKEYSYFNKFEQYKKEYEESLQDLEEIERDAFNEVYIQAEKEYCNKLIDLLKKTNNPDLCAAIVLENIPMDMVCVSACLPVIESLLMKRGINIPGLTIIVDNGAGLSAKISSMPDEQQNTTIRINLIDGHFQLSNDNVSLNATSDASKNNCLYEALCQHISELQDLTTDEFRKQIVKEIETNSEIREQLSHGWHKFNISKKLIGGAKNLRTPKNVTDVYRQALNENSNVWQINEQVDKNLIIAGPLNNKLLNKLRTDAFTQALQFCNKYLQQIQGAKGKHVFVRPYMFQATKYDTIFIRKSSGDVAIGYFPVEMKTPIEILVDKERVELVVEINLDNPCVTPVKHGPQDPHVGYKITAPKNVGYKTCGHIIMNKKGNEYLPHRRPDNIQVDPTGKNKIPISRLFNGPSREDLVLERTNPDYDKSKIRGKSFVTIFY